MNRFFSILFLPILLLGCDTTSEKATYLETIGGLSASNAYITLSSIGLLADGFENHVYDAPFTQSALKEIINLIDNAAKHFDKLKAATSLSQEDKKYCEDILAIFKSLKDEANALMDYTANPNPQNAGIFQDKRRKALNEMSHLFKNNKPVIKE
jgi:hypothetical protein